MFTDQTVELLRHFRHYKAAYRETEWIRDKKEVSYQAAIAQALLEQAIKRTANGSIILTKQARKFLDYPLGSEAQAKRRMEDARYRSSQEAWYAGKKTLDNGTAIIK